MNKTLRRYDHIGVFQKWVENAYYIDGQPVAGWQDCAPVEAIHGRGQVGPMQLKDGFRFVYFMTSGGVS